MQKATLETVDFLNKCDRNDRNNDGNAIILTFDEGSLHIKIPHTFGLEAVRYFLIKHENDIYPRFNLTFILKSIDVILENNTCVFDYKYFGQLQDTAMGIVFPPTYANLSMKSNLMILLN